MKPDWHRLCTGERLKVDGDGVDVEFGEDGNHRRHRVQVGLAEGGYRLTAFVAKQAVVANQEGLTARIWQLNRSTRIVGFRIDRKGRLIGEARVPGAGLTAPEFQFVVRRVAAECDRLEYVLTGRDVE